jgi:HK97 family phage portal protein
VSLFNREQRQWAPEPIIPPFPGVSMTGGGSPSIDAALRVSAVWACIRLVADTVSMMELHAYTMKDGVRVPIPDPPLIVRPSADATTPEWVYMLVASMMLRGNAIGRHVRRDSMQFPVQTELLNPDSVNIRPDSQTGALVYSTKGGVIPREDVFHVRAYRMPGSSVGLSPIQYAALAINREAAIQQFAYGYFNDAPHPQAVITSDQPIDDTQARTLKERILAKVVGREPLILGAGTKYQTLSVSPEESQFLATQKLGVAEIARIYGVPPEMIAAEAGNSMTYANVEQRGIDFLTYSIQPWLTRIETALSDILPGHKHVRFDTSVLTRTDMHTRITSTAIGIASHQLTPDEARALDDRPPLTDEQKTQLDLVHMTISPSGRPLALPGTPPIGDPNAA